MKGTWLAVLLAFALFSANAQAPELKRLLDSAHTIWYVDFDKTDQYVKRAERLISQNGLRGNEVALVELYNFRILSCNNFSRLQLWREYTNQLDRFLAENKSKLSPADFQWFTLRNRLAVAQYYYGIHDYDKSLEAYLRLLNDFKTLPQSGDVCDQVYVIHNDVATIYSMRGEYQAAVNQLLAGIPYWECAQGGASDYLTIYRNIGAAYLKRGDYQLAASYLNRAEKNLTENLSKNPLQVARAALSLYETRATLYDRTGKHDSALYEMKKALPLLSIRNVDSSYKGRISFSLANLYAGEGQWNISHDYFRKAEVYFLNSTEDKPIYLSGTYANRADLFERQGKFDEAQAYYQKAIDQLTANANRDADGNPDLRSVLSKRELFRVLEKKSQSLERQSMVTGQSETLSRAFRTNQLALALLDSTANEFSLDNDKVILAAESFGAYEAGLRMAYNLYQQTQDPDLLQACFYLMEKSKGLILLENLRLVNHFAGVNPELLEQERAIKSELFVTEQSLYQNENKPGAEGELRAAREHYAELKSSYAGVLEKLRTIAPDYYKLRFDHHVASPEEIRKNLLAPGEGLVEFFVGDSSLTVFGLSATKSYIGQKRLTRAFEEEVNRFRQLLTDPDNESNRAEQRKLANRLFDLLLKDCLDALGSELTSLTIVPDGVLGYVPLEACRTGEGEEGQYLAESFSIRYAHSASYLEEQRAKKGEEATEFFGGFVSSGDELPGVQRNAGVLVGARTEVSSIASIVGGGADIFDPATKNDFLLRAPHYQVLHLAMHSMANDQNPMLSTMTFAKSVNDSLQANQLTAIELYSLQLKAQMAVLSACETGIGALHRGEGIMSFSRAFSYAGVNSAVISLWKVPDKATARLMINFYNQLKLGKTKAEALRLAKLDLAREYPAMAHPYYWSGFILTGDNRPLEFPFVLNWISAVLGFAAVSIMLLVFVKRKRLKSALRRR